MAYGQPTRIRISEEMRNGLPCHAKVVAAGAGKLAATLGALSHQSPADHRLRRLSTIAAALSQQLTDLCGEIDDHLLVDDALELLAVAPSYSRRGGHHAS